MRENQAEKASDLLRAHGVRPSHQRVQVLADLLAHPTHPTVEAIHAALMPSMPTLSKTTVYNTLGVLCQAGIVRMVQIEGHEARYDAVLSEHGHSRCDRCGRIDDFEIDIGPLIHSLPEGFRIRQRDLYLHGLCRDCQTGVP